MQPCVLYVTLCLVQETVESLSFPNSSDIVLLPRFRGILHDQSLHNCPQTWLTLLFSFSVLLNPSFPRLKLFLLLGLPNGQGFPDSEGRTNNGEEAHPVLWSYGGVPKRKLIFCTVKISLLSSYMVTNSSYVCGEHSINSIV